MSAVNLCARCRLHGRLQHRIRLLQLQRQPFSSSSHLAQEPCSPRLGRYSRTPQQPDANTVHSQFPFIKDTFSPARREEQNAEPETGRYSGKRLRPEQLLSQLNIDKDGDATRNKPHQWSSTAHHLKRELPLRLAQPLYRKVDNFIHCDENANGGQESLSILKDIVDEYGSNENEMQLLGRMGKFVEKYKNHVTAAARRMRLTPGNQSVKPAVLLPSQLMTLAPILQIRIPQTWKRAIWTVANAAFHLEVTLRRSNEADDSPVKMSIKKQFESSIDELMALWNLLMASHLSRQDSTPSGLKKPLDWSFLPKSETIIETLRLQQRDTKPSFQDGLELLLPSSKMINKTHGQEAFEYASSALVTMGLLRSIASSSTQNTPFLEILEGILKFAPVSSTPSNLWRVMCAHKPEMERLLYIQMATTLGVPIPNESDVAETVKKISTSNDVNAKTMHSTNTNGESSEAQAAIPRSNVIGAAPNVPMEFAVSTSDKTIDEFVNYRIKGLRRATQKNNANLAESIKRDVFDFMSTHPNKKLPNDIFEHLMLNLLNLRRPQSAIEVWNHYIKAGNIPTTKTYTAMMRGAQFIRDINGMESFWNKMLESGLKPDNHAWSVRLFGLIKGGRLDQGLAAMNIMGVEWFQAAKAKYAADQQRGARRGKSGPLQTAPSGQELLAAFPGDIDGVARPGLVVMNSLVSALASKNAEHIPKVITWGRAFGVQPDVTTYNVLLHLSMRNGEAEDAFDILRRMNDQNIEATSETWTVLLTALFHGDSMAKLTHAEQQTKILSFIEALGSMGGVGIDVKGYALIIDQLLRLSNAPAAQAVLTDMINKGMTPTAHIYTILMLSYFRPSATTDSYTPHEPDFAAIESLWAHIQAQEGGRGAHLDDVFYDRMIESYATYHASAGPQPMLKYLDAMQQTGRRPSWRALEYVVRALDDRNDVNGIVRIVDDVRRWQQEGLRVGSGVHIGAKREYGQTSFWECVLRTGVLEKEGIDRVEQVLQRGFGENTFVTGGATL